MRLLLLALASLIPLAFMAPAQAQQARVVADCAGSLLSARDGTGLMVDQYGRLCSGGGTTPTPTTQTGITRTRTTCTLPAYASGGNIVCTDQTGAQTTTACAANTACLVSAANANRKTAFFMVRSANTTIDIGYSASVAPGNGAGIDGPAAAGGQGGSNIESPAHVGAYYAASAAASTLVFIQGQ